MRLNLCSASNIYSVASEVGITKRAKANKGIKGEGVDINKKNGLFEIL